MVAGAARRKLQAANAMIQDTSPEIKCDACDGRGARAALKPSPNRRIYAAACKKCGGKGRIRKPN
jgi:DnaJ-class molecular chaperone